MNTGTDPWPYGNGVIVYAVAESGEVLKVAIETKPNDGGFVGDDEEEQDKVAGKLFHVLQTRIFCNDDRSGAKRITEVEGTFRDRADAVKRAKVALLDDDVQKNWNAEFDEKLEDSATWEWGGDVIVHAVGPNGENYGVEIMEGK